MAFLFNMESRKKDKRSAAQNPPEVEVSIEPYFKDPNAAKRFTCAICMDTIKDAVLINCMEHVFCHQCIKKLISTKGSRFPCPTCRKQCNSKSVNRVGFIDKQIQDLIVLCPNHKITKEKERYIERKRASEAKINKNNNSNNNLRRSDRLKKEEMKETESEDIGVESLSFYANPAKIVGHKRKREDDNNDYNDNHKRIKLNDDANRINNLRRSERLKKKKLEQIGEEEIESETPSNSNNKSESSEHERKIQNDDEDDNQEQIKLNDMELCEWTGPYSELQKHINLCPLQLTSCEYCKKSMLSRDLAHHYNSCAKYPIPCNQCSKINIKRDKMKAHISGECPKTEIKCSLGCGKSIRRENMYQHKRKDCEEKVISCRYFGFGCRQTFKRKLEAAHHQDYMATHLKLVSRKTLKNFGMAVEQNVKFQSKIAELEGQIGAFKDIHERMMERISELEKRNENKRS